MIVETEKIKKLKSKLIELDCEMMNTDPFSKERKVVIAEIYNYGSELFDLLINTTNVIESVAYGNEWHISHTKNNFASWCEYSIVEKNKLKIEKQYSHDTVLISEILLDKPIIDSQNNIIAKRIERLNFKISNVNAELNRYENEKRLLLDEQTRIFEKKNMITKSNETYAESDI